MTIQDMERILDMPRATIRYYEREGLIAPARAENGYREYTDEDIEALEKVRLMRALGCSVAQIRGMMRGEADMGRILMEKGQELDREIEEKANVREICEDICKSGQSFAQLDAKKYLSGTWRGQEPARPVEPPKETPAVVDPWRRFWARMLDWQIYTGIWSIALSFLWPAAQLSDNALLTLLDILLGDLTMILLEPLLLHFLGTTPGKWALGLRVAADGGGKLTLREARERTKGVLWHGMRLNIPVAEIHSMWKRYRDVRDGVPIYWEDGSFVVQKRRGSVVGYIALRALIAFVLVCCMGLGRMPVHRGPLTPEEFAENYNRMIWVYGAEAREIDAQGQWIDESEQPGVVVIRVWDSEEELSGLEMDVRGGTVQGVQLNMRASAGGDGNMVFVPTDAMARAAIALVCAESPWYREMLLLNSDELEILRFCEGLDPTGRRLIAEEIEGIELRFSTDEDTGAQVYRDGIEIGGWEIGYEARSTGGVYSTTDHSAVILPEGEDGVFEMEFRVRRK